MKIRFALAAVVIVLVGCSDNHTTAFPGSQSFALQKVVDPFNLSKGNVIHRYALPNHSPSTPPYFIATGSDNNVWFTESNGSNAGRIANMSPTGAITEFTLANGHVAQDIAAGAAGKLWFTDQTPAIYKITTTGSITTYPLSGNASPYGIGKGPDGNMWFTEHSNGGAGYIGKITPMGTYTEYPLPAGQYNPEDIVSGPDGNLWFVESFSNHVGKITTGGTITEYPGPTFAGLFAIAAGPDGNLYATSSVGILRISTAGVTTEYTSGFNEGGFDVILGPDKRMWVSTTNGYLYEFNPKTHAFSAQFQPDPGQGIVGLTVGGDGDIWIVGRDHNSIDVYEEDLTTIGIRLNGEMSITDPTYGFELGYAKGTGTTTQTISLNMAESVIFKNLDTIPHSAAFLGNATPSPSTWPATFIGSTTKSPAFTAIGTTGFATGSLNPSQQSPVYETGLPGFYMIGCQYHYVSDKMRTVVIVH